MWQRKSFNYIYGFAGDGIQQGNPKYEILSSYPNMEIYYGTLAGVAYTIPESVAGLSLGFLKPGYNRKILLCSMIALAGTTQLATGIIDSLGVLFMMRCLQAACNSITNSLFFSLVADYFPKNRRGVANSIL
jgi:MFS family permease